MEKQLLTPIWLYSDHLLEHQSLVLSPSCNTAIYIEYFPLISYYNKHFWMGNEVEYSKTIQRFVQCYKGNY